MLAPFMNSTAVEIGQLHRASKWSGVSLRDERILALASRKLASTDDFDSAVRALREAVGELIPAGRVYLLGQRDGAPVVGSIVSGIGIAGSDRGVFVVQVAPRGQALLGRLRP
jgi:hypothetical protein